MDRPDWPTWARGVLLLVVVVGAVWLVRACNAG